MGAKARAESDPQDPTPSYGGWYRKYRPYSGQSRRRRARGGRRRGLGWPSCSTSRECGIGRRSPPPSQPHVPPSPPGALGVSRRGCECLLCAEVTGWQAAPQHRPSRRRLSPRAKLWSCCKLPTIACAPHPGRRPVPPMRCPRRHRWAAHGGQVSTSNVAPFALALCTWLP